MELLTIAEYSGLDNALQHLGIFKLAQMVCAMSHANPKVLYQLCSSRLCSMANAELVPDLVTLQCERCQVHDGEAVCSHTDDEP